MNFNNGNVNFANFCRFRGCCSQNGLVAGAEDRADCPFDAERFVENIIFGDRRRRRCCRAIENAVDQCTGTWWD